MKTLNLFVVELEKTLNDTIKTESGLELYVDNRFDEFEHRVTEGPVVCAPIKSVSYTHLTLPTKA